MSAIPKINELSYVAAATEVNRAIIIINNRFKNLETQVVTDNIVTTSNNQGNNVKLGDDCWIGDTNLANGFVVKGQQNAAQGYTKYGNDVNAPVIGNKGSQRLNIAKRDGSAVIPEYADNAAAVTAGLAVGDIYRTGDLLKIRH